jgi:hypothetical protein
VRVVPSKANRAQPLSGSFVNRNVQLPSKR